MVPASLSTLLAKRRGSSKVRLLRGPASMNDATRSFDALVRPHLADALALARWLTRNRTDAEDVLQEACLRAFRSIHTCVGNNPRAWVLTVLRNTAYSWLEKNRRGELIGIEDLESRERDLIENSVAPDWHTVTPEAELIEKANAEELRGAIERLPVEFRETLVLRDIHGLDYREIAEIVGVPVGTVMSRLSRARRHLLRGFQPERAVSRAVLRTVRNSNHSPA
jgi:RNA polymerase sigma factor (sigma-70 family)